MKIQFEVDGAEQIKTLQADSRGRITIGAEYAGETVSVAIQNEPEPATQEIIKEEKSVASDEEVASALDGLGDGPEGDGDE